MAETTPDGLCSATNADSFIQEMQEWGALSVGYFFRAQVDTAQPYEELNYNHKAMTEPETPICDDLTIPVWAIKNGVRLSDANVFRVCTTPHGVRQKEWATRWPYDFMLEGNIWPDRRPIGSGVVIRTNGMGFYPIFQGYLALCGETAGRYTSVVGPKRAVRDAPYKGFRVGQLLAMSKDFRKNQAIYDLNKLPHGVNGGIIPIEFKYVATDLVGLFGGGKLTLAPLTAFSGFCPYVNKTRTLPWTNKSRTGLTQPEWTKLIKNKDLVPQPSTLRTDLQYLSFTSQLFLSFSLVKLAGPGNELLFAELSDGEYEDHGLTRGTGGRALEGVARLFHFTIHDLNDTQRATLMALLNLAAVHDQIAMARRITSTEDVAIEELEARYRELERRFQMLIHLEVERLAAFLFEIVFKHFVSFPKDDPIWASGHAESVMQDLSRPTDDVQPR